ncbi:hypothetical protein K438DRAFT_1782665 [Mycena galopus ATCC 62051]|nr:hypothetical protein K438DRAFT_1782665 [Mycena galopus ATCC 62051]
MCQSHVGTRQHCHGSHGTARRDTAFSRGPQADKRACKPIGGRRRVIPPKSKPTPKTADWCRTAAGCIDFNALAQLSQSLTQNQDLYFCYTFAVDLDWSGSKLKGKTSMSHTDGSQKHVCSRRCTVVTQEMMEVAAHHDSTRQLVNDS